MTRFPLLALSCGLVLIVSLAAAGARADTDIWTTGANNYWTLGPWSLGHPPLATDGALFNQAATYEVLFDSFTGDATINKLFVTAGDLTLWTLSGPTRTVNITNNGVLFIEGASKLTLYHLIVNTDQVYIRSGSTLNVNAATLTSSQYIDVGQVSSGTLLVDVGSSATTTGTSFWGNSGGQALVTFSNTSTGSFGEINIASSAIAGTGANVHVLTGADLNTGHLNLAANGATATLNVQGSGSTVTQSGASTLTVGHSSAGSAVINIGTTNAGAAFTTGTGQTTINKTGTVNIGAGTFNADGNLLIDGGLLDRSNLGAFNLAVGKTMTIQNAGRATINTTSAEHHTASNAIYNVNTGSTLEIVSPSFLGFVITANAQVNVNSGGSLVSHGGTQTHLDIGRNNSSGNLIVDGNGSRVTADSGHSFWGGTGNQAFVTLRNGATGTFGLVNMAPTTVANSTANVDVQSGAHLNARQLYLALDGGSSSTATLNVQGSGSSVTLTEQAIVGHSATGTATINVGTTASGAVLTSGAGGAFFVARTGTVTLGSTSTTGSLIGNGDVIISGGLLQVGVGSGVVMAAGKTLTLSNQGKLKGRGNVLGSVFNGGIVTPGLSPGTLTVSGSYTQTAAGVLEIELSSIGSFDRLFVSGTANLGGTLAVSLIDGFVPKSGDTFDILDWTTRNGSFTTPLQLPDLTGGLQWNTSQLYTSGVLSVGLPGDFNLNGTVDAADYVVWRKNMGTPADYNLWRSHFGQTAGSGSGQSAGSVSALVPEPTTLVLLLAGALLMLSYRPFRDTRIPFVAIGCGLSLIASLAATRARADTDIWTTGANNYWTVGPWSLDHAPFPTDSAVFNQPATYSAIFDAAVGDRSAKELSVAAGTVTLQTQSGPMRTVHLVDPAGDGVRVQGGALILSGVALNSAAEVEVNSGGSLNVNSVPLVAGQWIDVGTASGVGTLVVNGSGSATASSPSFWGDNGGQALVTFDFGATGTFGTIDMSHSPNAGTSADVRVQNGADLNTGHLLLATNGGTTTSATLSVQGSGSSVTQSGASTLTVGHSATGSAAINIGTTVAGAAFTTGTGGTTINKSGAVTIGAGTLNANGNVLIDGGTLDCSNLGTFNLAIGKTMTVQNGGRATIEQSSTYSASANATYNVTGGSALEFLVPTFSGFAINQNAQVYVNSGGSIELNGFFNQIDVGVGSQGTLVVDGNASRVTAESGHGFWGAGGSAFVTIRNGATATFGDISLAQSSASNTSANVDVFSGAHLDAGKLYLAIEGGSSTAATLNVQGSGAMVTLSDQAVIGHSATGTAAINIGTTASGAVFATSAADTFTIAKTGTVTLGSTSTTGSLVANGNVVIDGGLLQAGAGSGILVAAGKTLTLSNQGKLKGSGNVFGSVVNNGVVAPGVSPGTLPISGNYTQTGGVLEIELSSLGSFDRLVVSGTANLGGTLAVSLIDGFVPASGSTFDILDWTTRNGTFATLQLSALGGGRLWNTSQLYTSGVLSVGLPGDFNLNGKVDAEDYVVWRKNMGTPADYNFWRANFGATAGSGAGVGANAAVPEPTTWILTILAAAGWCLWRGRTA